MTRPGNLSVGGACVACGTPFTFEASPVALRKSPKLYCSSRCKKHAAYLRRKGRLATERIVIPNPRPCDLDGWPMEGSTDE